jgi:hypothetical protein
MLKKEISKRRRARRTIFLKTPKKILFQRKIDEENGSPEFYCKMKHSSRCVYAFVTYSYTTLMTLQHIFLSVTVVNAGERFITIYQPKNRL